VWPAGLILLKRGVLGVADVIEIEPADVHLVDRSIPPTNAVGSGFSVFAGELSRYAIE
jgi:hypothetical protein